MESGLFLLVFCGCCVGLGYCVDKLLPQVRVAVRMLISLILFNLDAIAAGSLPKLLP